jgi:hypothetical protein
MPHELADRLLDVYVCMYVCIGFKHGVLKPTTAGGMYVCMYVCQPRYLDLHLYIGRYVLRLPRPAANDLGSSISTSRATSRSASARACMAPYAGSCL